MFWKRNDKNKNEKDNKKITVYKGETKMSKENQHALKILKAIKDRLV
ncbi:hypothetical protein [Bacillus sp. CECT 9360]|nr:hypothetical protein [Bacillus sp. CECT 9360]CAH0347447.1 hypothetical protein BCI9360_03845 [Bacillus sp. CECT 9360]